MAGVQDDSSGAKTMAARAASDRAASRLKATCNGLALFDQREQGEAEGTWGFRRRRTVAGAPFFKRQPLAGRSDHGAPFFKRQRIAGRRHHATTNCDRTTARHFSSDSASLAVDIMRRQIAVSLLRRGQCARPYLSAQIQRGNVEAWMTRALRMSKSACAQCTACFVTHARHAMAMLFC